MRLRPIVGQPGNSNSISRVKLRRITVQLGKRAGFNDVGQWTSFGSLSKAAQKRNVRRQIFLGPAVPLTFLKVVLTVSREQTDRPTDIDESNTHADGSLLHRKHSSRKRMQQSRKT